MVEIIVNVVKILFVLVSVDTVAVVLPLVDVNAKAVVVVDAGVAIVVEAVLCRITRYTMRLPPSVCGASQNSLWTEQ